MAIYETFRVLPAWLTPHLEGTRAALLEDRAGFLRGDDDAVLEGELIGLGRFDAAKSQYAIPTQWTGGGVLPASGIDEALELAHAFQAQKGFDAELVLAVQGPSSWMLFAVHSTEGMPRPAEKKATRKKAR